MRWLIFSLIRSSHVKIYRKLICDRSFNKNKWEMNPNVFQVDL